MSGTLVNFGDDLANAVTTFISLDVVGRSVVLSNELESVLGNVETIGAVGEHHSAICESDQFGSSANASARRREREAYTKGVVVVPSSR